MTLLMLGIYYGIITKLLNKYCPERMITTKAIRAPYITNEVIQLSKNRDKLFRKAHRTKNANDWEQAVLSRSEANAAIRNSRRHYIINEVKAAHGNTIKFWETMKNLIPSSKSDTIKSVYSDDSTTLLHGKEAANRINSYFCNISNVLDADLPPPISSIPDSSKNIEVKIQTCKKYNFK